MNSMRFALNLAPGRETYYHVNARTTYDSPGVAYLCTLFHPQWKHLKPPQVPRIYSFNTKRYAVMEQIADVTLPVLKVMIHITNFSSCSKSALNLHLPANPVIQKHIWPGPSLVFAKLHDYLRTHTQNTQLRHCYNKTLEVVMLYQRAANNAQSLQPGQRGQCGYTSSCHARTAHI